jgi:tetratricopeptide (TPR) repeat protein
VLGIDHPDTLAYRNNLARAYQADGRAAQAIAMHEQTLADFERLLGSNHLDTLTSRNNLALAYKADGRAAEAIQLLERTLGDFERLLGADHPKTATVLANLTAVVEMRDRNNRNSRRRRWLRR